MKTTIDYLMTNEDVQVALAASIRLNGECGKNKALDATAPFDALAEEGIPKAMQLILKRSKIRYLPETSNEYFFGNAVGRKQAWGDSRAISDYEFNKSRLPEVPYPLCPWEGPMVIDPKDAYQRERPSRLYEPTAKEETDYQQARKDYNENRWKLAVEASWQDLFDKVNGSDDAFGKFVWRAPEKLVPDLVICPDAGQKFVDPSLMPQKAGHLNVYVARMGAGKSYGYRENMKDGQAYLFISQNRTLVAKHSHDFETHHYTDSLPTSSTLRVSTTYNSLPKFIPWVAEIIASGNPLNVFIDEFDEMAGYIVGDLCKDVNAFTKVIQNICIASADSGGHITLASATPSPDVVEYMQALTNLPTYVVVNEHKPQAGKVIKRYASRIAMLERARLDAASDGKVLHISDSKQLVKEASQLLRQPTEYKKVVETGEILLELDDKIFYETKEVEELTKELAVAECHGDHSDISVEEIARNPEALKDFDVVSCSPVMTAGISIEGVFTHVYGDFKAAAKGAPITSLLQQLGRERYPQVRGYHITPDCVDEEVVEGLLDYDAEFQERKARFKNNMGKAFADGMDLVGCQLVETPVNRLIIKTALEYRRQRLNPNAELAWRLTEEGIIIQDEYDEETMERREDVAAELKEIRETIRQDEAKEILEADATIIKDEAEWLKRQFLKGNYPHLTENSDWEYLVVSDLRNGLKGESFNEEYTAQVKNAIKRFIVERDLGGDFSQLDDYLNPKKETRRGLDNLTRYFLSQETVNRRFRQHNENAQGAFVPNIKEFELAKQREEVSEFIRTVQPFLSGERFLMEDLISQLSGSEFRKKYLDPHKELKGQGVAKLFKRYLAMGLEKTKSSKAAAQYWVNQEEWAKVKEIAKGRAARNWVR